MKLVRHSSLRYALVGVSNTAVGFAVIWLTLRGLGFSDVAANVSGYAVGFLWSFALNRAWTFRHAGSMSTGLMRYAQVCLASYAANLLVVVLLAEHLGQGSLLAQIGGMAIYTALGYVWSRMYAFAA